MNELIALWLPIIVTTAVLFVVSSLLWAVLPVHDGDFTEIPDQDALTAELERQGITSGQYLLPFVADRAARRGDAFKERYAKGPQALLRAWPEPPSMGKLLGLTVVTFFVLTTLIAYVGSQALGAGAPAIEVFQIVGTIGVLTHGAGGIIGGIWFGRPLRAFITETLDGIIYGLTTGAIFAWLWPAVPEAAEAVVLVL